MTRLPVFVFLFLFGCYEAIVDSPTVSVEAFKKIDDDTNISVRCPGVHIGDGYILTAYHCFDYKIEWINVIYSNEYGEQDKVSGRFVGYDGDNAVIEADIDGPVVEFCKDLELFDRVRVFSWTYDYEDEYFHTPKHRNGYINSIKDNYVSVRVKTYSGESGGGVFRKKDNCLIGVTSKSFKIFGKSRYKSWVTRISHGIFNKIIARSEIQAMNGDGKTNE